MTIVFKSDYKIQEQIGPGIVHLSVINMFKIFENLEEQENENLRKERKAVKGKKKLSLKEGDKYRWKISQRKIQKGSQSSQTLEIR